MATDHRQKSADLEAEQSGSGLAAAEPMITILLIVLVLMMVGAVPAWPHSRNWGYYPSGGLGLILIVVLLFVFLGPSRW